MNFSKILNFKISKLRNKLLSQENIFVVLIILSSWLIGYYTNKDFLKFKYYVKTDNEFIANIDKYLNSFKTAKNDMLKWLDTNYSEAGLSSKDDCLFKKTNLSNNVICVGIITKERFFQNRNYISQTAISLLTRTKLRHNTNLTFIIFNVAGDKNGHSDLSFLGNLIHIEPVNSYYGDKISDNPKVKEAADYSKIMKIIYDKKECKYGLLIEDDAIAAYNWYDTLIESINFIEKQNQKKWLSLKLFTSFRYYYLLRHLPTLIKAIIFSILITVFKVYFFKFIILKLFKSQRSRISASKIFFFLLNSVFLVFYLKSYNISPLGYGVHKFSQGFNTVAVLYPREQLLMISEYVENCVKKFLTKNVTSFVPKDIAIYKYRLENKLDEFILEASIFQHIGLHSSLSLRNGLENVKDFQYRPFQSYSFIKEYDEIIKFDPNFWLS